MNLNIKNLQMTLKIKMKLNKNHMIIFNKLNMSLK